MRCGVAVLVLFALIVPDLDRLRDFADFRALHPDRANEGGLGNLPGQLSPLEALGDLADERVPPLGRPRARCRRSSSTPVRCWPRSRWPRPAALDSPPRPSVIPAALLTAVLLYLAARAFGTVYTVGQGARDRRAR